MRLKGQWHLTPEGRLLHTYSGGQAKLNAYVDDYAFLIDGLIALHRATGDQKWLDAADRLTAKQIELFADESAGGFYFTADDHEQLIHRSKSFGDEAVPAQGQVVVRVDFSTFTGRTVYHCHILDHEDLGMMATVEVG